MSKIKHFRQLPTFDPEDVIERFKDEDGNNWCVVKMPAREGGNPPRLATYVHRFSDSMKRRIADSRNDNSPIPDAKI